MPKVEVDVSQAGNNPLSISIRAGQTPTLHFYASDGSNVSVQFTATPPFTDTTNPFAVSGETGVDKTVSSSATTGDHNFSAGDRTGDIDIRVSK